MRLRAAPARARAAGAGLALALALPAAAQTVTPLGPDFEVHHSYNPSQSEVAMDADGDFVIVWGSENSPGNDTDASVQARRYAKDGSPQGPQFQVNSYTTGYQGNVAVATAPDGRFVVAWRSASALDSYGIVAQRYAADGSPQGGQFQVNSYTTNYQNAADVAVHPDGGFVVVWHDVFFFNGEFSASVQGRRFAADGSPLGAQFQINSYTTGIQAGPSVAPAPGGGFVVSWLVADPASPETGVRGQRFASDGLREGPEFQVDSDTTTQADGPTDIAVAADGDFLVTWRRYDPTSSNDIRARRFAADGSPQGAEFQVNTFTTGFQENSAVAAGPGGEFFVVWEDGFDVDGRLYAPDGEPVGAPFQVNSSEGRENIFPAVASSSDGRFISVWKSAVPTFPNTLFDPVVRARRFALLSPVPALSGGLAALCALALLGVGCALAIKRGSRS